MNALHEPAYDVRGDRMQLDIGTTAAVLCPMIWVRGALRRRGVEPIRECQRFAAS